MEENYQNLWDVINDPFVVILANENMCVAFKFAHFRGAGPKRNVHIPGNQGKIFLHFCPPCNKKCAKPPYYGVLYAQNLMCCGKKFKLVVYVVIGSHKHFALENNFLCWGPHLDL